MGIALEISFYLYVLLFFTGIFFLVWLLRWLLGGPDPLSLFPQTTPIASKTIKSSRLVLDKVKQLSEEAKGDVKKELNSDIALMQRILEEIIHKIEKEQGTYQKLCKNRESLWYQLQNTVEGMGVWQRIKGRKRHLDYQELLQQYLDLEALIEEEVLQLHIKDDLHLSAIQNRGGFVSHWHLIQKSEPLESSLYGVSQAVQEATDALRKKSSSSEVLEVPGPTGVSAGFPKEVALSSISPNPAAMPDRGSPGDFLPLQSDDTEGIIPLSQADFPRTDLKVSHRTYQDPEFSLSFEPEEVLRYYRFENSIFQGVRFIGVHRYESCHFENMTFNESAWAAHSEPHHFRNCVFVNVSFKEAKLEYCAFYECDFQKIQWIGMQFTKVKFVRCHMREVNWQEVDLSKVVMSQDMLESLDFSHCLRPPQNFHDAAGEDDVSRLK